MGIRTGSINFVTDPEAREQGGRVDDTRPFRVLVLGSFSGRRPAGRDWREGRPVKVDRDNIEDVLAKIRPTLSLETGTEEGPIALEFRELDDFHPDRIHAAVPLFDSLRAAKGRLSSVPKAEPESPPPPADGGSVLDLILGATQAREAVRPRSQSPIEAFFREVGEAHGVRADDAGSAALRSGIDGALGRLMASILHDPSFQALEASWRSLDRLVRKLDTDRTLSISILDVSKEELLADFDAANGLKASGLHRLVVEPTTGTPGAVPWATIVADYTFEPSREDVVLLGFLGMIGQASGAPVLGGASPRILGCDALYETPEARSWRRDAEDDGIASFDALRTLPVAKWLGLALPRILARLPYSRMDRPIEAFDFEEFAGARGRHEEFLWGNPAYLLAELLGRSFREDEWEMSPGSQTEILDLPVHVHRDEDEPETLPCAEVVFTQSAIEAILERGLMPMLSYKGRDAVRLARFQSIADPAAPLEGPWG